MKLKDLQEIDWSSPIFYIKNKEGRCLAKITYEQIDNYPLKDAEVKKITSNGMAFYITIKE